MTPQTAPAQSFINTADLDWTVTLDCTGDYPPAGAFFAHMKRDLASLDVDKVFSEVRGNLIRGAEGSIASPDAGASGTSGGDPGTVVGDNMMPLVFKAPAAELVDMTGAYTVDLYYQTGDAIEAIMRVVWTFEQGA